jgi:hypothetical protein
MSRIEQALDLAIEATEQSFLRHPANVSDERSLAEDVRSRICSVLMPASVESVDVNEPSGAAGAIPDHERYTARYRETTEIDRAQCEVGGPEFPFGAGRRLDLAVFEDGLRITVDGGTQAFRPSDVAAAVEVKYVKNINYLRHRPDDENSKYRDIAGDIERLGELDEDVDARCVVFGNYDMLRRDDGTDAKEGLQRLADESGVNLRFVFPEPAGASPG